MSEANEEKNPQEIQDKVNELLEGDSNVPVEVVEYINLLQDSLIQFQGVLYTKNSELQLMQAKLNALAVEPDHEKAASKLRAMRQHVNKYFAALDDRQHGGVAQGKALDSIIETLGMAYGSKGVKA